MQYHVDYMTTSNSDHSEARTALENRIRIKQNEISEREQSKASYERELARVNGEIAHNTDTIKRIQGEVDRLSREFKKEVGVSKSAEEGLRMKDNEIQRKNDELKKFDQELILLKRQFEEKERIMAQVKD